MRHADGINLTALAEEAGFRVKASGDLPLLHYIQAVR
jgi:hypothetical protein